MILFKDISYAQGIYNMDANPDPMVMMKMSGAYTGSKGLYYDSQAAANYNNAIRLGKIPFMYHFAGGGDPVAEADWFVKACSPLAAGDGLALDWEIEHADPIGWCLAFVNEIFNRTGVWPWVYVDRDRLGRYDWTPVLNKCGLWVPAPDESFDADLNLKYTVIAQQGPIVNGVDTDAFFGDLDQLRKYTYQPPPPAPPVVPETPTEPPIIIPTPVPPPVVDPPTLPPETTPPLPPTPVEPTPPSAGQGTLLDWVKNLIKLISDWLTNWRKG